jgi:hypothetical protein
MVHHKIEREPVNSDFCRAVGYDPARLLLDIEFDDGHINRYMLMCRSKSTRICGARTTNAPISSAASRISMILPKCSEVFGDFVRVG